MKKTVLVFLVIICAIIGIAVPIGNPGQSHFQILTLSVIVLLACLIMVLSVNKLTNGEKLPLKKMKLSFFQLFILVVLVCDFLFIYPIDGTVAMFHLSTYPLITSVVAAIEAGTVEEYLMRGYVFQLLFGYFRKTKYTLTYSAFLSSLIFGCLHFMNLGSGQSLEATLQQMFYATCLGMFFATIRITFNRIYIVAILHIMFDMQSTITTGQSSVMPWIPLLIVFGILFVLSLGLIISYDRKNIVLKY